MASFGHVVPAASTVHRFSPINVVKVALTVVVMLTLSVKLCSSKADDTLNSRPRPTPKEPEYFDQFYAEGVKAYSDQLWYKCAHNIDKAVREYRTFKKTLTDCRMRCKKTEKESEELLELPALGDLSLFESFLRRANCFRKCKSDAFELRPGFALTKIVENTFESRKPYQYLQYCWYKLDRVKLAASASYTFYLKNPEDVDVKRNIAFYRDKAKVAESDFLDLELVPYKEHYIRAMMAYGEEDWPSVTDYLEKTIQEFLVEEERCRADCEDVTEITKSASHFTGIIADHFVAALVCQLGCERNLSVVYTEPEENFFSELFHYLQYAYYKTDKISEAVAATTSHLLFHPEDEVMKENKKVFMKKYHYDEEQFIPREDAKLYVDGRKKLQALYDYLQKHFIKETPDVIFVTAADAESDPLSRETPVKPTMDYLTWMDRYERLGLHLIAKGSDLHRPFRFAADGLLKQEQCEDILTLMEDVPVDKKGVQIFTLAQGRERAPVKDENYEASLRLFMRATEVMRHYTQRYYNMSGSLFFKNTVMVCWRQVPDPDVENDCIPQEFGTCDLETIIQESELVEDQFVTVTYLNSIDDGDIYFLGENVSIDTSLGVKYGRTVGFQSGDRHGLHIPSVSTRCAMVITYTRERTDEEKDYTDTVEILQRLEDIRMERGLRNRKEVMQKFKEMGVQVVKNSTTLHGGERFIADGLASDAECVSLKNMVMDLGRAGDGYEDQKAPNGENELFSGLSLEEVSKSGALFGDGYDLLETKPSYISPHTQHELFQGLTIYRASKLMHSGVVNTFAMKSFLDLSEKSRLLVEKYFNLTRPLYFDFTHLVCRTPIDERRERDDLSHPVHADNCILKPDGSCVKEYPAYVQRDYSAILYLNDDFGGGEFFFAHSNKSEQVTLQPKCGRLVGFNAKEYHGVRAVRSGTRCALAMWYTLNPNFKELAHVHARKVLRTIQTRRDKQLSSLPASHHTSQPDTSGNADSLEKKNGDGEGDKDDDDVKVDSSDSSVKNSLGDKTDNRKGDENVDDTETDTSATSENTDSLDKKHEGDDKTSMKTNAVDKDSEKAEEDEDVDEVKADSVDTSEKNSAGQKNEHVHGDEDVDEVKVDMSAKSMDTGSLHDDNDEDKDNDDKKEDIDVDKSDTEASSTNPDTSDKKKVRGKGDKEDVEAAIGSVNTKKSDKKSDIKKKKQDDKDDDDNDEDDQNDDDDDTEDREEL